MTDNRMTRVIRINAANTKQLLPICDATRYSPAMLANMLIEYALKYVRLKPTAATVYDLAFWGGSEMPRVHNTRQILPQLLDRYSGLRGDN